MMEYIVFIINLAIRFFTGCAAIAYGIYVVREARTKRFSELFEQLRPDAATAEKRSGVWRMALKAFLITAPAITVKGQSKRLLKLFLYPRQKEASKTLRADWKKRVSPKVTPSFLFLEAI